jgi:hypothetical protein
VIATICDGCQKPAFDPHEAGYFVKKHYCDDCWPAVEVHLEARDRAHTRAAEKYREKISAISAPEGFGLPDV